MSSPHELRRRIRSISGTAQITKAMEMVAASKMRKAQESALAGRPFVYRLYRIQREATTRMGDFSHPLLEVREVRKRAIILIGADKGLCGALNSNLFRLAAEFDTQSTLFITAGKVAAQFIAQTHRQLVAEFAYGDTPRFTEARAIAAYARDLFLKREVDQVQVIATRFINTLTQQPLCLEYLPVAEIKGLKIPGTRPEEELIADTTEALFEPSPEVVMGYLLLQYLDIYIYQVLLNAKASEQSARMVSMKNATDSAETLINDLTLEYNKLRQGNITQELLEIAGGQSD
ncbi:ATP synthase F1 subunit gamma [Edaphobacter modestus]|uniref:ATP synthase gamma chain n=1 Tax=Edaphobacter modestus TaxID=388466 RepID=A0A4Q7YTY8_9BACT|nr:ATP synthase F1 subunit gamma [Edaphobacter modestus]RZU40754.1 F-type H+-transporting ATPase subunit gamma [Edaphobacter modestus]